jgi:heat shock protein HslJ
MARRSRLALLTPLTRLARLPVRHAPAVWLALSCSLATLPTAQAADAPPAPNVSAASAVRTAPRDVRGAWKIVQARTEPILDTRRTRLDLGADGRLSGHTSCNTMSGDYALDGSSIRIGRIVTTRMACGPTALEQEDRILSALEAAKTIKVRDDGLLEIRDEDGRGVLRALRFETAQAEPETQPPPASDLPKTGAGVPSWPVVGRQGAIKVVIVPLASARDRTAYDREIGAICGDGESCFVNFFSNSTGAPVTVPLPDAIANEATAVFRRSVKQGGEFFRWSCRLGLPTGDCF